MNLFNGTDFAPFLCGTQHLPLLFVEGIQSHQQELLAKLNTNDWRETVVATARTLARTNEGKKRERRQADEKRETPALLDPRSQVARQYMRMSEEHDRIRMKVLGVSPQQSK